MLGIHAGEAESRNPRPSDDLFGPPYEVRIGFETQLPLAHEADRLRAAGFDPTMITEDPEPRLQLSDPDGEDVQIHSAP